MENDGLRMSIVGIGSPPPSRNCSPTIYSFLLSDVVPSLSPALAHGTTYLPTSPQHHLCSPSEND